MKYPQITLHWGRKEIGYPTDPDDHDFESPRTPPVTSAVIEYRHGDTHLRQGVQIFDPPDLNRMTVMLLDWLSDKLKEQA